MNKKQLLAELAEFADSAKILINVGTKHYPISCVISGTSDEGHAVMLETPLKHHGRRPKYATDTERRAARLESYRKANEKRRNKKAD